MWSRMLCAFVVILATGAAAADKGMGLPPPPKSASDKDREAWVARYIDAPKDDIFGWMEDGVLLVSTDDLRVTPSKTVRFWSRSESYAPLEVEGGLVRSSRFLYEVDCMGERLKTLAVDSFTQNNLLGEVIDEFDDPEAAWTYPRPGTTGELIVDQICEYVAGQAEQAESETRTGMKGAPFR